MKQPGRTGRAAVSVVSLLLCRYDSALLDSQYKFGFVYACEADSVVSQEFTVRTGKDTAHPFRKDALFWSVGEERFERRVRIKHHLHTDEIQLVIADHPVGDISLCAGSVE